MSQIPSKFWPYIKRFAQVLMPTFKAVEPLTGAITEASTKVLIELQDELAKDKSQGSSELKAVLETIHSDTSAIVEVLRSVHPDLQPLQMQECAIEISERLYLKHVADEYRHADFKGISQMQQFVFLELDAIFVALKARPQKEQLGSTIRIDSEFGGDIIDSFEMPRRDLAKCLLENADSAQRARIEDRLAELDQESFSGDKLAPPQSIDELLKKPGGLVLLGGPGSGKTTLMKRLARSRALSDSRPASDEVQSEAVSQTAYPALPTELFPFVLSITLYDDTRGSRDLSDYGILQYVEERLADRWGSPLVEAFRRRWAAGQVLLLIDGLDEVADQGRRTGAARAVDAAVAQLGNNRLIVTSRIIGYSLCALSVPVVHATLEPFSPEDIATFARQWHRAFVPNAEAPRLEQADRDAQSLIDDIRKNERVAELATNPLMLTIIAFIKHQHITLPDRRVELFEKALETLIQSWNKARSLSGKPIGETPHMDVTKRVWSQIAFWMHGHSSRGTLRRQQLLEKLIEVLMADGKQEIEASEIAESYLRAATETSGLLEARGQDRFAFMHQTFQEYLAAIRLATLSRKSMQPLIDLIDNPRWHEIIRLAAGYIGIYFGDNEQLSEFIQTLLDETRDPLEPYLLTGLRLAASCIADDVGYRQSDSDAVVALLIERRRTLVFEPLKNALCGLSLEKIKSPPGLTLQSVLVRAAESLDRNLALHAVRLLGMAHAQLPTESQHCLDRLLERNGDDDDAIRAAAAKALWITGTRRDDGVLMAWLPNHPKSLGGTGQSFELIPSSWLIQAMTAVNDFVVFCAAYLLGERVLSDEELEQVRPLAEGIQEPTGVAARYVIGKYLSHAPQESVAFRALEFKPEAKSCRSFDLLGDVESNQRTRSVIYSEFETNNRSSWTQYAGTTQSQLVVGALMNSLNSPDRRICFGVIQALVRWRYLAPTVEAIIRLFDAEDSTTSTHLYERELTDFVGAMPPSMAAPLANRVLSSSKSSQAKVSLLDAIKHRGWRQLPELVPTLKQLLSDSNSSIQLLAAVALGKWGYHDDALPTLLDAIDKGERFNRARAIREIGEWDNDVARVALQRLAENPDQGIRIEAARAIGNAGRREDAIAIVSPLLESNDLAIQLRVTELLGTWNEFESVTPCLLNLLSHKTLSIAQQAKRQLKKWRLAKTVVLSVLDALAPKAVQAETEAAAAWLSARQQDRFALLTPAVRNWLAKQLKIHFRDSQKKTALREILYQWVWEASGHEE